MTKAPTFTVFTPTFNRVHTLERVYRSLLAQTYADFEWLIVDDGSRDNTKALIASWQSEKKMAIRYLYQENQGKPSAHNRGIAEASGRLFLPLDSDDACTADSLERLLYHWEQIPQPAREGFSGVTCHCRDLEGRLVGTPFPAAVIDATPQEMHLLGQVRGEKWGFQRTDVLRSYPFPLFPGEKFVPEGLVWNRIGRKYKIRHINEALRLYDTHSKGMTATLSRTRVHSPRGMRLYYRECLDVPMPADERTKTFINYLRASFHAGIPPRPAVRELSRPVAGALYLASLSVAFLLFRWDRRQAALRS